MQFFHPAVAFLALAAVSACTDPNPGARRTSDYSQSEVRTEMAQYASDPARKNTVLTQCRADMRRKGPQINANMAVVMKVSADQAPKVFCDRIFRGLESGRLTSADVNSVSRGTMTPATLAVLQGE